MHNGLQVSALGYCGAGMMNLLIQNRGVHEPQQERIYAEILKVLPPESTMLELGANWGFYSLWFASAVPKYRCFLIEPSSASLHSGMINFRRAGRDADFLQAYIGAADGFSDDQLPIVTVDSYSRTRDIDRWSVLHADIDGAEVEMLRGAYDLLDEQRIDHLLISTHGNIFHCACLDLLQAHGYHISISIEGTASYSVDGLIVAHGRGVDSPDLPEISRKRS